MHRGREQSGSGRNRHADKILAIGPARVARLCIVADVEPREPARSTEQKQETDERARLHNMLPQ